MIGFGFRPPCGSPSTQAERISALVDGATGIVDPRLVEHVRGCEGCGRVLRALEAQGAALARFGDAPGAAPTEAAFHRIMATLSAEKRQRRLPRWFVLGTAAALTVIAAGVGTRALLLQRERRATDEEIVAGADAAYRRAEREYTEALSLLRERLDAQLKTTPDPKLEAGIATLAAARQEAAALAVKGRADAAREALLREAFHAEIRYYEDALLRGPATVEVMP